MFEVFKNLGRNLATLDKKKMLNEILSVRSLQAQIIDLNQAQMYDKGVDSDGVSLGNYSMATIYGTTKFEGKIQKGQRYDHVTLKDTGESYDTMKVIHGRDGFFIDGKFPESVERKWPDALGLTNDSKDEIIPEIKERLIDKILQHALK